MKKNRLALLLAVSLLAGLLVPAVSLSETVEPIRIGLIEPLSGSLAA